MYMKRSKVEPGNKLIESKKVYWKRRPSEIRGYQRTLYLNADNGDYIRVDYNLKEKRVRLYIEDTEEGGIPYYSVISSGKITAERNASTGRAFSLKEKFSQRADIFSTLSNRDVLKLINKNYGIGEERQVTRKKDQERQRELERTRDRYFKAEGKSDSGSSSSGRINKKIRLIDGIDLFVGANLCLGFYYFNHTLISVGIIAAFFGILLGIIDIFFRRREPIFSKIVFFIITGASLYVYGYYIG